MQLEVNPIIKLGSNSKDQALYFFGARHTNDPTDTQFEYLKQFLDEFLNVAKGERTIFVEGATRETPQNYEEAIREYGETGAINWLARESDIETVCPEPSNEEQRKALCVLFSPQIVAYTMITQYLAGWFRQERQLSFENVINRTLDREAKFSEIYGFVPERKWLDDQHKKLFGEKPLEDKEFVDSISDPRKSDTEVNLVVATRTKMRNEHVFSKIAEAWKEGKSVFIVYGKGHLATLEHSLRELVVNTR